MIHQTKQDEHGAWVEVIGVGEVWVRAVVAREMEVGRGGQGLLGRKRGEGFEKRRRRERGEVRRRREVGGLVVREEGWAGGGR